MNAKELADQLNGTEYSAMLYFYGSELELNAKAAGLVIAYGYSDDLVEFEGAIRDEAGAPGTVLIDAKGILPTFEAVSGDEYECQRYFERKPKARAIEAVWDGDGDGYAWTLKTDIPHETFGIFEDGAPFSRGIVFALADLRGGK